MAVKKDRVIHYQSHVKLTEVCKQLLKL